VITVSAALETTDLRPESIIDCHGGTLRLPGRVVSDSHKGIGRVSMAEVLARSSNVGAIEVGRRVGAANLYEYVRRFGFARDSGRATRQRIARELPPVRAAARKSEEEEALLNLAGVVRQPAHIHAGEFRRKRLFQPDIREQCAQVHRRPATGDDPARGFQLRAKRQFPRSFIS
jgi:membrane peptidoglycan carboxypeptidase